MNLVALGDIANFSQGLQIPITDQKKDKFPGSQLFLRIINYTQKSTDFRYVSEQKERYIIEASDIIMVRYGAVGYVGRGLSGILANNMFKIDFNERIVDGDYLYRSLKSDYVQIQLLNGSQSTSMAAINFKSVAKVKLPLPPLEEQKKIAAILDAADEYRQKTKALIDKYDQLTQSLFSDMFGDPVTNPKGWEKKSFTSVFGIRTGKLDSNQAVADGQYPFFTCAKEVSRIDSFSFDQEALMLAGNNAAGVYDVKHYKGKFDAYQRTYVLTLNEGINYQFFRFHLEQKLKELQKVSIGSGTKYLTIKILQRIMLLCPDHEDQSIFTSRVAEIEKQKQQAQASLVKAEELFSSLLQRAFKGELTS